MYGVTRRSHERHGHVIHIERSENGSFSTPFQAVNGALKERRLAKEGGLKKIRFLIDDQVMGPKQIEHWAAEEYKSLPKCEGCAKILNGNIFNHQLAKDKFFCSQDCADNDYNEEIERRKDEEEIDYL